MNFTFEDLDTLRKEGYTDDQISSVLQKEDPSIGEVLKEGYTLDQITSTISGKPMPEPEPREFFSFEDAVSAIGTIPEALAVGVPAAYQKLVTGLEIPEKSEAIESELAFQQRIQTEQADRVASGKATTFGSAIREALPSLGFSVLPMAAAIPAGIGGTMVGGPAAPVTGPAAAMAASGTVAYRMAGSDMMYRAYKQLEEAKGSPLTNEEKAEYYKTVLPIAQNYGLWEAGPEAVSNAITMGVGKFVFGFGKQAAKKLVGESIDSANKTIARKVAEKGAAVAGGLGTEIASEGVTSVGQYPEEAKIRQLAATGEVSKGEQPSYPGGYIQAVKDVAPATIALYGMMGTAAGGVKLSTLPFRSQKTPEQIAEDNINLEADRVSRELSIGETDEETKSINAALQTARNNLIAKKEVYTALEPNDPAAQSLGLEIREMEREVVALDNELKKRIGEPLSEPITEAERQQAELAKAIVEEPAPTEPLPVPPAPVKKAASTPPVLYHGGRKGMSTEDIQIVREPGATKQGKRGRVYGGFYTTEKLNEAEQYAAMLGEDNTVYEVQLNPSAVVETYAGDITRLSPQRIEEFRNRGVDIVVGKDVRGRTENVIINKEAVASFTDINKPPSAPVEQVVTPPVEVAPTPKTREEAVRELEKREAGKDRLQELTSAGEQIAEESQILDDILGIDPNSKESENLSNREKIARLTPEQRKEYGNRFSSLVSQRLTITPAPTITEAAPVEPITPAPVTEQAAPAEAPAPEVAPVKETESASKRFINSATNSGLKPIKPREKEALKGFYTFQAKDSGSKIALSSGVTIAEEASPNELTIEAIYTPPKERETGSASKLLQETIKIADENGITLNLEPQSISDLAEEGDKFLTPKKLAAWYKRYGFEQVEQGSDKFLTRKPKSTTPAVSETITEPPAAPAQPAKPKVKAKQKIKPQAPVLDPIGYGNALIDLFPNLKSAGVKAISMEESLARLEKQWEEKQKSGKATVLDQLVYLANKKNTENALAGDSVGGTWTRSDLTVAVSSKATPSAMSHEIGHAIMELEFANADQKTKDGIIAEYNKWFALKYGKDGVPSVADQRRIWEWMSESDWLDPNAPFPQEKRVANWERYRSSFKEWFADEVAKWATTNAKPKSLIEKFFTELAAKLNKLWNAISENFAPNETLATWLDSITDVSPSKISETITPAPTPEAPAEIAVGNRVKLGRSPQTYTIQEVIPQTATEQELGEQYYSVKNERTGEVQVVEKNDVKPVKAKADKRYNPLGYDIAEVVEDIKAGKTDTPLRAVNQVIKEAQELRGRIMLEAMRRKQPRKVGKAAILERIARERSAGTISEATARALTDFVNSVREDAIGDTSISIRQKGVSNFDFADNLVTFFLNQDKGDLGAAVGIHEFWHGLSRFLPESEVQKINKEYVKELEAYLKKNPWFLAFVGRYSLSVEQFNEYKKFNPVEAETKLEPVRDAQGNIIKYKIKFDKSNYRYIMLDEFIAEKMTDLVLGKQQEPNTFLGKLAKILREFMALIKARLGIAPYEKFYQAVTSTNGKLVLQRETGVAPAMQIYDPVEYDYSTRRMMAVEPTPTDREQPSKTTRRTRIMSVEAGEEVETPEAIIARTKDLLRKQFDPTKVTEKNTTEAFRALGKLAGNRKEALAYAEELNDIGRLVDKSGAASEISMGAALFVNDLFEYSIRLAAEGDSKMLGIMMANINRLPTAMIGASDAGRTLAARAELKARFSMMGRAEQDAYTNYVAEFIYGPNPTKEQIQSVKDAYAAVDKTAPVTEQELTDEITAVGDRTGTDLVGKINDEFTKATEKGKEKRRTEEQELDKEYKKIQKQADAEIEKLAKIQSDTPSFDPASARQITNDVRAIVSADLKQKPDMGRKAPWKSMLVAKLQEAGVELTAAETLADIVWRQHEINSLSRELSSINKAIEKGPISEIVKAIKDTPLEDQQKPNWRYEVMRDYLRKAGLPLAQAERIAKLMDISLQKRFTMAQEQAFTDAISKSAPWKTGDTRSRRAFQKVLQALRAGALDPARNVLSDMAALNGWTGFTPEQYKALLKNDAILSDPESADATKAEAHKAIQDIISKAKLPIRARDVIGQFYDAQALSGIPTMTVNIFSPAGMAVKNALTQSLNGLLTARPEQITAALTTFIDSIKSWANTVAFSFKNNVTVYSNVEYLVNDEGLLKLYKRGVDQFNKGKTPRERADGVKNMMIGMMDYVRRVLNALDYGAIASLQNQAVSKYALAAMQAKGMSSKDGAKMLNAMMEQKRNFYNDQIAIGTDKNKAAVLADEFFVSSWRQALTDAKLPAQQVMDAALNDAMSAVGRNRQSLDAFREEETNTRDGGVISYPALWLLETMANAANKADNQVVKLFSRMIYGFAVVPARVFRETAWFSPYGGVRFAYDYIAKKMGKTSPYAQSLGNDLQRRQRMTETITGSIVLLGFLAAMSSSTEDEEDEKPFKIVVTGNGPLRSEDPQYYDSWTKKHKANTVSVYFGKTKFTINTMRGFEAFAWPAMMLGAVDDWQIRRKQKRETNTPMQMGDAAIIGGFVLSASLRRGPYAFAAKPLFEAYGDRGVESLAKSLAFPAKTLVPVLGASLARNLSDFLNEPVDRKTLEGALWANVPFIGPAVSPKSLNAFGEPALANEAADKIFKLGVPITFNIPTDRDSVNLHELVLKQGGGPSIPTRNQLAQRLDRQPTNKEYEMFVKEYGGKISSDMKRRYEELSNKTPEKYSKSVEKIGDRARDIAERKVREAAKKP